MLLFFCFSCNLKQGSNSHTSRQQYLLISNPNDSDNSNIKPGIRIGEILIEPISGEKLFKATVYLEREIPSSGYQLFINGESNYKMLEYGKPYYFVGEFDGEKSLTLRMRIDDQKYIVTSLKKTINYSLEPSMNFKTESSLSGILSKLAFHIIY
ncbi:hypothetical protein [Echinicola sp. 20G]|uniref:hypothetical protein n=1 Tax=Echinicola sp. 20G TaxID=2781961 RepID=UPI0019107457|nr:hypothetical protein [Echinicola sp. 20G]